MTPAESLIALAASERAAGRLSIARRLEDHARAGAADILDAARRGLELLGAALPRPVSPLRRAALAELNAKHLAAAAPNVGGIERAALKADRQRLRGEIAALETKDREREAAATFAELARRAKGGA